MVAAEPDALTDVLQINSRFPYCGIRFIFMSFSVHGMLKCLWNNKDKGSVGYTKKILRREL